MHRDDGGKRTGAFGSVEHALEGGVPLHEFDLFGGRSHAGKRESGSGGKGGKQAHEVEILSNRTGRLPRMVKKVSARHRSN